MTLRRFSTLAFAVLLSSEVNAAPSAAQKELGWDPAHTWVFAVGVLHWKHSEMFGSFPVKERRDAELVDFFKRKGVPEEHVLYLQDENGTQKRIDAAFNDQLRKIGVGDTLIVYYPGHGVKSRKNGDVYLASYDAGDESVPGWSVNSIPKKIAANCAC